MVEWKSGQRKKRVEWKIGRVKKWADWKTEPNYKVGWVKIFDTIKKVLMVLGEPSPLNRMVGGNHWERWFRWFSTIGPTMEWLSTIVQV